MATQPTNLPVPSETPRDLKFNAGKIDEFVNSLVNTYIDRFGQQHYTIEGLRWLAQQAIAQYGWIPVGTFQAGATLTLPNQILKDETDGEYYRWDGSFLPSGKIVSAGSTPASSGGVGVGKWLSVGDSVLRSDLAKPTGASHIGVAPGRTQADKNTDMISVKDNGAVGNSAGSDGNDDTSAFQQATAAARAAGKPLLIDAPHPGLRYRLTSQVDLRGLVVHGSQSLIWADHDGVGIILGGNASKGSNPDQDINTVERSPGRVTTSPTVKVVGAKGQRIWVKYTDWLQVWAEKTLPEDQAVNDPDRSSAYSSFYINWAPKITIEAPSANGGWINENDFYLNRCTDLTIQGSTSFRHNHNRVWGGTFENAASITINRGADNKFYNMRFEGGPTLINFGTNSERNVIINTWAGSEFGGWPDDPLVNGTITDNGGPGNIVIDENQMYRDSVVVASSDINDVVLNFTLASSGISTTRGRTLQKVTGPGGGAVCLSDYMPVTAEDHYFFEWRDEIAGTVPKYRPFFEFFDKDMKPVANAAGFVSSSNINVVDMNEVRSGSGLITGQFGRVTKTAEAGAVFMRVGARASAGELGLATAKRLSVTLFTLMKTTKKSDRGSLFKSYKSLPYMVSGKPTEGFAQLGFEAKNSNFTAVYHCTSVSDTTLQAAAASGATTITVTDVAQFTAGDVLGINTDNGETFWTAVSGTPAGNVVTLAAALNAAAASGSRVIRNRWRTETLSVS